MSFEMMENQPGEVPRIIGYVTPWSGHAGQDLAFKVSSRGARSFVAQVQRVDCCDPNPLGPGMKLVSVDVPLQASYVGEEQSVFAGSCAVGPISVPADARQITVEFTIRPTTNNVA